MLSKPLKSKLHEQLEILNRRMKLSKEKLMMLKRMQLGYEGELQFYKLIKKYLSEEATAVFDLLLDYDGTEYQIDCLIIFQYEIYLFEIKNYEGDFLFADNNWYLIPNEKIRNPLHQINRTELLFTKFLRKNNFPLKVSSYVVFINPEFMLYQAPENLPVIYPSQLGRLIKKLTNIPSETTQYHSEILNLFKTHHKISSSFKSSIDYDNNLLNHNIFCVNCGYPVDNFNRIKISCKNCGEVELVKDLVIRNAFEFQTLFPQKKITVGIMYEWLNFKFSKHVIREILKKHAIICGAGKNTFYKLKL